MIVVFRIKKKISSGKKLDVNDEAKYCTGKYPVIFDPSHAPNRLPKNKQNAMQNIETVPPQILGKIIYSFTEIPITSNASISKPTFIVASSEETAVADRIIKSMLANIGQTSLNKITTKIFPIC